MTIIKTDPTTDLADEGLSKGQRTSMKILEAAARCVAKIGAEKTSVTAIAEEAGLKRSLIAYHFPKKEEIFFRIMVHIMYSFGLFYRQRRKDNELQAMQNQKANELPLQDIQLLAGSYLDYFHYYPHYFHCTLHCFYLASINRRYKILNTKILSRIMIRLMGALKRLSVARQQQLSNRELEQIAQIIYSNLIGTVVSYFTLENPGEYQQFKKHCLELLTKEINLFLPQKK